MKPWIPDQLPLAVLDAGRLISAVGEANAALSGYDGLLRGMVNPGLMLSPLLANEAVLSSRIEGTQATLGDVFESDAGEEEDDPEKKADLDEVLNYRAAMREASDALRERPITLGLIRALHAILMRGVRGQDKEPGTFRTEQNWIGPKGCQMEQANFVPPNPIIMGEHLDSLELYVAGEDLDPLVQAAVFHAQFEIIHPFKDGNGRLGRLLIPLFIFCKNRIHVPMFYLSGYLDTNRDEYYGRLRAITDHSEWNEWVLFFLRAITHQARLNTSVAQSMMDLYEKTKTDVQEATHSRYSAQITDMLFKNPIFRISTMTILAEIPAPTSHQLVKSLIDNKIVTQIRQSSGRRPALYVYPKLMNLAEGRVIFAEPN